MDSDVADVVTNIEANRSIQIKIEKSQYGINLSDCNTVAMTKLIDKNEACQRINNIPGWVLKEAVITRSHQFDTFMDGITFINKIANEAEKVNHHPDITISWRNVMLSLTTHDAGGLTEKDFEMAKTINSVFQQYER